MEEQRRREDQYETIRARDVGEHARITITVAILRFQVVAADNLHTEDGNWNFDVVADMRLRQGLRNTIGPVGCPRTRGYGRDSMHF